MPNSKWLDKYSDEPTVTTIDQIREVLSRVTLPSTGLLKGYEMTVRSFGWPFSHDDEAQGYYVLASYQVPDTDPRGQGTIPVKGSWHVPVLPMSERQLMNFLMAHVRSAFMHEFEEHFMVDGVKVLEPHGTEPYKRPEEMGVVA